MHPIDRRTFLKTGALALGAGIATRFVPSVWAQPVGANDAIRVGVIGLGWMGSVHARAIAGMPGARITALCDVDPERLAAQQQFLAGQHVEPFGTTDPRRLLERADVDAVVIATPNHWHALLTVWACQAGKDVYVEKPISHSIWQGRRMVDAAARYGRIVQAGTQTRSDQTIPQWQQFIREGHAGAVQWIHAVTYKLRPNIGLRQPWYPAWLDYDFYCGPAPKTPLRRDQLHYDWHWMWETGNGDLANIGVHQVDLASWLTGQDGMPPRVVSLGGRFVNHDAAQTPNLQITLFDYDGVPFIFENRGLPAKPGVNYVDHVRGLREGILVQCEGGYFTGFHGGAFFAPNGGVVRRFEGDGGAQHMANFFAAVRSRRADSLAAPIATGHRSTKKCLYGNISYRLGRPAAFDDVRAAVAHRPWVAEAVDRARAHLAANGVDLAQAPLTLGAWVRPDDADGIVAVDGPGADLAAARELLRDPERPGFAIPETFL